MFETNDELHEERRYACWRAVYFLETSVGRGVPQECGLPPNVSTFLINDMLKVVEAVSAKGGSRRDKKIYSLLCFWWMTLQALSRHIHAR